MCQANLIASARVRPASRRQESARAGFSLVEAIVALSVTAMAGAVLLLAVESTLQSTTDSVQSSIADGLAQQLLDEILTKRFVSQGGDPLSNAFGPSGTEAAGAGRERYDDSDDFHGFAAMPAEGRYGEMLGTGNDVGGLRHASMRVAPGYFENWRQRVEVYFVDPNDHRIELTNGSSLYRAIEVTIELVESDGRVRPLATRKQIIAYVQPPE